MWEGILPQLQGDVLKCLDILPVTTEVRCCWHLVREDRDRCLSYNAQDGPLWQRITCLNVSITAAETPVVCRDFSLDGTWAPPGGLLKTSFWTPHPQFLILQYVWSGTQKSVFLTSSPVMLTLLVWGPHFESQCSTVYFFYTVLPQFYQEVFK